MNDPVIICPNCKEEIKLTESLAAPLVEATRQQYEVKLVKKESEISKREAAILDKQIAVTKAEESLEEQVIARLAREREKIAAEEAKRARLLFSEEIGRKGREVSNLQEVLKAKEIKLSEAQKAQAGVIRKQRELDDAKRELVWCPSDNVSVFRPSNPV